jgi:hypothetical protein
VIPWKLVPHAVPLGCYNQCGRVSLSGLWPKAELGSTRIDLVYSIVPEWLIRPASTRFVIGLQSHACSGIDLCRSESMEEAGSMRG